MSAAKNMIESLREIVQDLLVPELKAVKVSVESLRQEMKTSNDSLRQEKKSYNDALVQEMKSYNESLRQELRLRDEMNAQAMRNLSEKLDFAIDIRERLAIIEARLPRQ